MKICVNTLFPSTVQLTEQFGGGKITVKGNFPSVPTAEIHLEICREKNFTLEFRLPANTSIADVSVNSKKTKAKQNSRGFFELKRMWKKGDVITIDLGSNALPQMLNRLSRSSDSEIGFTVEGTGITLIPYYQTGSKQSGPRTYFELKNKK